MRVALCLAVALGASALGAEHPFILWTDHDLAALRRKIETEDWARRIPRDPHLIIAFAPPGAVVGATAHSPSISHASPPAGESLTFAGHAFVRIGPERVEAWGRIRAMKMKVKGPPRSSSTPSARAQGSMAAGSNSRN